MVPRNSRPHLPIPGPLHSTILELLDQIEREQTVRILYACESGSRAWGFASPDSDYDVRFLFVRPAATYVSVRQGLEVIERPHQGDFDAAGWDLRKAARLLLKSNGPLLEWLHSPIVYRAQPGFVERWRAAAHAVFSPRATADHYRGLARRMITGKLEKRSVRAKDYLYALRAVLAGQWIVDGRGIPPVPFESLLDLLTSDVHNEIPALLELKARTLEADRMARRPVLDAYLDHTLAELDAAVPGLEGGPEVHDLIDCLLRAELRRPRSDHPIKASDFTLDRVREPRFLLFDAMAGSAAYGTSLPGSDEDRRGVFAAPTAFLLGLERLEQVSDERHDSIYYELGRFVDLLLKNNPNALELLGIPEDCVRFRHPLYGLLRPQLFLSKLSARTFGEYAMGQIRKARGLNKKIVHPQPEQRKTLLEFCYVPEGQGSVPVLEWLARRGLSPDDCGLTAVPHAVGLYALYHDPSHTVKGLVSHKDPDVLLVSSLPRDASPIAWLHCSLDAFKVHCRVHREYHEWVALRNPERYRDNTLHGRGYDSKNLIHTFRLLDMAKEIASEGVLRVRRPDPDALLRIRSGEYSYDDLVRRAEEQLEKVRAAFARSSLPEEPDWDAARAILLEIRAARDDGW